MTTTEQKNADVSEATVDSIQNAIRTLAERGTAGCTSIRALADLAGVGRATVYRAFNLRPGLLEQWSAARQGAPPDNESAHLRDLERRLQEANTRIRALEGQLDAFATALHALELDRRRLLKTATASVVPIMRDANP